MSTTTARRSAIREIAEQSGGATAQGDAARRGPGAVAPAVICFPFVGDLVGGSHRSAAKLIQNLDRERYQPLVVLHRADGDVAALFRAEGIAFEPAPCAQAIEGGIAAALAFLMTRALPFARFLRARDVAIVHTNDGGTHATWALPTHLAGAKLLWHHRKDPDARSLRYLAPWAAHRVVSVSHFAAPRPGPLSAARKCTVVYSPFDTAAAQIDRAAARRRLDRELGCPPGTLVVGFFGNLVARKRPLAFVDALAEIRARAPGLPLAGLIFGHDQDGLAAAVRERAAARGVADCVHLMGFRYPPEPWIAACDVHLVTAVDEPFGRSLIEAMLLGTVVVAAASGGNIEAIRDGKTGWLVPPDDAAAAAEQIVRIATDPERRRAVARAAYRDATSRFGLREHAEAIMDVYDALLRRAGARSPDVAPRVQPRPRRPEQAGEAAGAARGVAVSRPRAHSLSRRHNWPRSS